MQRYSEHRAGSGVPAGAQCGGLVQIDAGREAQRFEILASDSGEARCFLLSIARAVWSRSLPAEARLVAIRASDSGEAGCLL
jgi:hypothetical protein